MTFPFIERRIAIARIIERAAVVGAFALATTCFYFLRVADPDLWWHIKVGELIATTGTAPATDPYSFTAANRAWIDHEWATHLIFYKIYDLWGGMGLTTFKTLLGAATAVLLYLLASTPHSGTRLMVFLLAAQILGHYAVYRPQVISYFFLSLLLYFLAMRASVHQTRSMIAIPLVFLLWANLHGGFVAGLAILGLHTVLATWRGFFKAGARSEQRAKAKRLVFILAASIAITLVNPYGFQLWRFLSHEATANALNRAYIEEWEPLWASFPAVGLDSGLMLWMAILALVGFVLSRHEWRAEDIILAIASFGFAFYSVRNIALFPLVTVAPTARSLGNYMFKAQHSPKTRRLFAAAFGISLFPVLMTATLTLQQPAPKIQVVSELIGGDPSGVVSFMKTNHLEGNLYNPIGWGGYLVWHVWPQVKVSIDGRSSTVYPLEVLRDNFRFYANQASPELPLASGADFLLVNANSPVLQSVRTDHRWALAYEDRQAVLFAGTTAAGQRLMRLIKQRPQIYTGGRPSGSSHRFP
ncbi:MAG TPA: hypothetical protein VNL14_01895 [Candidatus Acidoferrales bacterium]|nr:hypothetical protein [Candidatus Acidoferrales bacterium]